MEHITVRLAHFEGPFDLLFHLIEKNKMDIRDVQVSVLADQYLEYVSRAAEKDMDNMSEFLVMAATLLELKCRLLLPLAESGDEDDLRRVLMEMLAEYRRYKEAADMLYGMGGRPGRSVYKERDGALFDLFAGIGEPEYETPPLGELRGAFLTALGNRRPPAAATANSTGYIDREAYNVRQKMDHIRRLLKTRRRLLLSRLFAETGGREESAAVFHGLLLLVKDEGVSCVQRRAFGDVVITFGGAG